MSTEHLSALISLCALVAGAVMLSLAYGWQTGVGAALVAWFVKGDV